MLLWWWWWRIVILLFLHASLRYSAIVLLCVQPGVILGGFGLQLAQHRVWQLVEAAPLRDANEPTGHRFTCVGEDTFARPHHLATVDTTLGTRAQFRCAVDHRLPVGYEALRLVVCKTVVVLRRLMTYIVLTVLEFNVIPGSPQTRLPSRNFPPATPELSPSVPSGQVSRIFPSCRLLACCPLAQQHLLRSPVHCLLTE